MRALLIVLGFLSLSAMAGQGVSKETKAAINNNLGKIGMSGAEYSQSPITGSC